ncbi:Yip1 family protein [Caulobacter endophyticus]|uniref:Yip1 family protein n=1 Tax=Caulobacter endophyticus TaxID=2172652 RepID=UPI00240F2BE9|nr:Yip1 family protein [Caulobacter endophyticus]MDG2529516.1 Yip1 family protein [Caulobacter endophyticus]
MSVVEPGAVSSDLVGRVKRILLTPSPEWERIDTEPATIKGLYVGYVCILAAIPAVAGLVGSLVFGQGIPGVATIRPSPVGAIIGAVVGYGLSLLSVFVLSLIIDALAPSFDGQKNKLQAFKVAAYSGTAGWVAGIFGLFPPLAIIGGLLGLYGLYLLYTGLPRVMKAPKEKAIGYTIVTVICAIVLYVIVGAVTGFVVGAAAIGGGLAASKAVSSDTASVTVNGATFDTSRIEAATKRMEAAQAGKVSSASPEALKALLPGGVSGYARTSLESQSAGADGLAIVSAKGEYEKDGKRFTLSVTDLGAMSGMAALAGAMNAQSSTETDNGYEKVGQVNGQMTTEKWDRQASSGGYTVVVADRFSVEANGEAGGIDDLKRAVASVDAGKLKSLAR